MDISKDMMHTQGYVVENRTKWSNDNGGWRRPKISSQICLVKAFVYQKSAFFSSVPKFFPQKQELKLAIGRMDFNCK